MTLIVGCLPFIRCLNEGAVGSLCRQGTNEGVRCFGGRDRQGEVAVALSLMETLCRVVAAQERHAEAAGVAVSLVVPNSDGMRGAAPPPLSRAMPALLRAVIGAVAPGETVEVRVEIATPGVVQMSIAGRLRPSAAFVTPPDGGLGGFELPAPARRAVAMVMNRGGRVEDRSSAVTGRLRLIVRLYFNPEDVVPVKDAGDGPVVGVAGTTPHRPRGPRRR